MGKQDRSVRPATDALRLVSVSKVYDTGAVKVVALAETGLTLAPGTFTAVMGPSGSGKSTLLHCASGLDRPTTGTVVVDGETMSFDSEAELTKFRRGRIGFIFQQYNLIPTLTVLQNVTLPARIAGLPVDKKAAQAILEQVGLGSRLDHVPAQLSGGEQQRAAIARALVSQPRLLFADEPTGALDTRRALEVLRLLADAVRTHGQTVVMVTHDPVAASHADSVLFLADGHIVGQMTGPTPASVAQRMADLTGQQASKSGSVG